LGDLSKRSKDLWTLVHFLFQAFVGRLADRNKAKNPLSEAEVDFEVANGGG
jgi:hypothetical protein